MRSSNNYVALKEAKEQTKKTPIGIKILVIFFSILSFGIVFCISNKLLNPSNENLIVELLSIFKKGLRNDFFLIATVMGTIFVVFSILEFYVYFKIKKLLTSSGSRIAIAKYIGRYFRIEWSKDKSPNKFILITAEEYNAIKVKEKEIQRQSNHRSKAILMPTIAFTTESGKTIQIHRKNHNPKRVEANKIDKYTYDDPIGIEYPVVYLKEYPENGKMLANVWIEFHLGLIPLLLTFFIAVGFYIVALDNM